MDLYPALREVEPPDWNRVRYELFEHFGYFVTESSEHFAEYSPWFIKDGREDLIERFNVPLDEYPRRCERQIADWEALRDELEQGGVDRAPSARHEYGADIIRACETGEPFTFNGNVPNRFGDGLLIDNLPADCCVEVPCVASSDGVDAAARRRAPASARRADADQRQRPGPDRRGRADRPPRRRSTRRRCSTPTRVPSCRMDEIRSLVDDLLEAHGDWIPTPERVVSRT